MKIKIFTFFYGNNYGALLQSLFLKTFLKNNFKCVVDFDNYQPKKFLYREDIKPIVKKNIFRSLEAIKRFYKIRKWKKKHIKTFPVTDLKNHTIDKSKYLSIYGSDEIWNFQNPFFGYEPHFFGYKNTGFKLSYAASFGTSASSEISGYLFEELNTFLQNFKFISVRDLSSCNFLKKNFNINAEIVLDPIFLIDNEFNLFLEEKNRIVSENYCLIYGQFFSKNEINIIINICKIKKLKLVSIGYYNNWVDLNLTEIDPSDFLNIFKYADNIFTSMFHGVLFSVKYNKPFWFTNDPYRKNKLDYFIDTMKIKDRMISQNISIDDKIDYISINIELEKQKKMSKKFINNCVKYFLRNENKY